ncbi:MAG: 4'-phosphopantetheinyl transferase superfamily protein [Planctomycetes bacterium]|nr:4'-phosphopantetheinyl transferase superfamily protein [Planctomycetota bacterium]
MSTPVLAAFEPVVPFALALERIAEQSSAARRALRRAADECGLGPVNVSKTPAGAPQLDRVGWHVSLAHTRELALAVLAERPVGADLEDLRAPRLAKLHRFFEPAELARLGSIEPRALAELWTAKEATLKLAGAGLEELSHVVLVARDEAGFVLSHRGARRRVVHREIDSHLAALCVEGELANVVWLEHALRAEPRP